MMNQLKEKISAELTGNKAFDHLTYLVEDVGERIAGTKEIEKAAYYITNKMEAYGLTSVHVENFPMYHSHPKTASLKITSPETRKIEAKPLGHIASTLPEGIVGEVVHVGAGSYEDYEGKDVKDKIVHAHMTWDPARPEKARIAVEKGVKALIISNWGPEESDVIQRGAVKSVWGNPTPETIGRMPNLPVISITRSSGDYLRELCQQHKVIVELRAEATQEWVDAHQPLGWIKGAEKPEEFIVVGGHLEAWGGTAICNSSGVSLMLELARVFTKYKHQLKRSIVFGFWDGHEVAEAAGSTHFVDTRWNKLNKHGIAYMNVDNPGIKGTSVPQISCEPILTDFMEPFVSEQFDTSNLRKSYPCKGGDASFFGVGVPYLSFSTGYTDEELEELNQATLSPWLHSEQDTIDKIDKKLLVRHLKVYATALLALCNREILPYNLVAVMDRLIHDLKEVNMLGDQRLLSDLIEQASHLKHFVEKLEKQIRTLESRETLTGENKDTIDLVNSCLMKVNRNLSHVLRTVAGRYEQDPYDYTYVKKPVPRLYLSKSRLTELEQDTHQYHLWYTKLLREKNSVADAIQRTIDYLEGMLPRLEK